MNRFCAHIEKYSRESFPEWGHTLWAHGAEMMEAIPCGSCRPDGIQLWSGMHDLKNYELGKPIFNPPNFRNVSERYANALKVLNERTVRHVSV